MQRLIGRAGLPGMRVDLDPARRAVEIGAAVRRRDFQIDRRLFPDFWNFDARDKIGEFFVLYFAGAAADDEVPDAFRMPRGIIQRGKAAAGDAEQVEFFELEVVRQHREIAGNTAGLLAGACDGGALAPAPAIESDDAIAGR